MEIGPYRLQDKEHLVYSDGAWDEFANVLFVDNPVGTGFSYVDTNSYVTELTEMANQMVQFLDKFFALFPEYVTNDVGLKYRSQGVIADVVIALHRWRVIRRPTYPLHRQSNTGPQQQTKTRLRMEPGRSASRQRLDLSL